MTFHEGEFVLLRAPIVPSEDVPHGLPGAVLLKGQCYLVTVLTDTDYTITHIRFDGLSLSKAPKQWEAKFYYVAVNGVCGCPHSTYRKERCKHSLAASQLGFVNESTVEPSAANHTNGVPSIPF